MKKEGSLSVLNGETQVDYLRPMHKKAAINKMKNKPNGAFLIKKDCSEPDTGSEQCGSLFEISFE